MRGWLHRELCDYENALAYDEEGVKFAQRWRKSSPEISARLNVCLDLVHLGDPAKALALLESIEESFTAGEFGFHSWRWQLRLLHARGFCYLSLGQSDKALTMADEGLALANTDGIAKYTTVNHELRGAALSGLDRHAEAVISLESAVLLADSIHYQPVRRTSRFQLADLYRKDGLEQKAESVSACAAHITQEIATSLDDDVLRDTFLRAALPR
jgi:tetratricopeptide (TPR) repeat protein